LFTWLADCISQGGKMRDNILDEDKFNNENFLEKCGLIFNVEDFKSWNNDQFYVEVYFEEFEVGSARDFIRVGNMNLKNDCNKEGKNLPVCVERSFYSLDNQSDKSYIIKIKSVVRKTEKNVR
jgi:hypothetical protein